MIVYALLASSYYDVPMMCLSFACDFILFIAFALPIRELVFGIIIYYYMSLVIV